ncbi:MAG: T9SS type A sorting domain-containing protein [Flavobacteriales bacterium]|nr:T9SS type A sorting domain-containing protein [Flavobacteriales bacterium]
MRYLFFLFVILACPYLSLAQNQNFYQIIQDYKASEISQNSPSSKEAKMFNRWSNFYGPRVYPSGDAVPVKQILKEYEKVKFFQSQKNNYDGDWSYLGPDKIPNFSGGAGRLNCMEFHPSNSQIMWVGAPNGGLWKTIDGGLNWSSNTDLLPNLGVTDIAINPLDPDVMYIATGDGYGYPNATNVHWGGTYTTGVLKSVDGGQNWNVTGLSYQFSNNIQIFQMLINPQNPNILFATASDGLYKTIDAGLTWTKVISAPTLDIAFKTDDFNTILVTRRSGGIWKSTDGGNNWVPKYSGSTDIAIETTPADPNRVYAWENNGSFQVSYDAGETWTFMGTPDFGVWYYMALGVSLTNPDEVYVGNLDISRSTNGGVSWSVVTDWIGWPSSKYVHADNREIKFDPTNHSTLYAINDGGIFKSTNNGSSWVDISEGIHVMQLYRFSNSQTDPKHMLIGSQDNGQNLYLNDDWSMVLLADGMESIIDPWNPGIVYATYQNGGFQISYDNGQTFNQANLPSFGSWTVPMEINPNVPNTVYVGLDNGTIYKSTDQGSSWSTYGVLNTFDFVTAIATCPSEPTTMYALTGDVFVGGSFKLEIAKDGGSTWTVLTGLPTFTAYPSDITVSESDASKIWVTFSGYGATDKVYYSNDYGNSWTNISQGLPKVPVNCVIHDGTTENGLYIGTDLGVFYKNDSMLAWSVYNDGLPNVIINELEIIDGGTVLRAATYGRGIWESPVYSLEEPNNLVELEHDYLRVYPTITDAFVTIQRINSSPATLRITDTSGKIVRELAFSEDFKELNLADLTAGTYFLNIQEGERVEIKKIVKL